MSNRAVRGHPEQPSPQEQAENMLRWNARYQGLKPRGVEQRAKQLAEQADRPDMVPASSLPEAPPIGAKKRPAPAEAERAEGKPRGARR